MPAPTRIDPLVREGREAIVTERLRGGPPARCPYSRSSKRYFWWQDGAKRAAAIIDQLERLGA